VPAITHHHGRPTRSGLSTNRLSEGDEQCPPRHAPRSTNSTTWNSTGAEMVFQVLTEREEKNSIAIASNGSFSGWTKTFTDPRLCAAIVDRLTFTGTIIETGTQSYRLAHKLTQAAS
jgi:hypothetical protein